MSDLIVTCYGEEPAQENRLVGSPERKRDALEGFRWHLLQELNKAGKGFSFLLDANQEELTKLFADSYDGFFNVVNSQVAKLVGDKEFESDEEFDNFIQANAPSLMDNVAVSEQKGALYNEVIDFLRNNGLTTKYVIDDSEAINIVTKSETDEPTVQGLVLDPFDTDPAKAISNNIKLLSSFLIQTELKDGVDHPVYNSFGFPKFVDQDLIKRTILNTVVGNLGVTDMFAKLDKQFFNKDLGRYNLGYNWIGQIKDLVKYKSDQPLSRYDRELLVGFEQSFKKMMPEMQKTILNSNNNTYSMNSLERDNNKDVTIFWNSNIIGKINEAALYGSENNLIFNHNPLRPNVLSINRESQDYKNFIDQSDIANTVRKENIKKVLEKLQTIGIDFKRPIDEIFANTSALTILNSYKWLAKSLEDPKINTFDQLFKDETSGDIAKLTKIYNNLNPQDKNLSTLNAEGENKYPLNDYNTAGLYIQHLDTANSQQEFLEKRPDLSQQSYFNEKTNNILRVLFDKKTGERLPNSFCKLSVIDGLGIENQNEGKTTRNLFLADAILQKFINSLHATYTLGINSDKNTEWAIKLSRHFMPFIDTQSPKEIAEVYNKMLINEMDAAMQDLLKPSNRDFYKDNVWKLAYFKEILEIGQLRSFITEVLGQDYELNKSADRNQLKIDREIYKNKDVDSEFEKYQARRDEWIEKNYVKLANTYNSYINTEVHDNFPELVKSLNIKKNHATKTYSIPILDKGLIKSILGSEVNHTQLEEKQVKDLIKFAFLNYEIAQQEFNKLIFGHASYMKDPVKRQSMFLGVKRILSQNEIVLTQMHNELPRTDLRKDYISDKDKRSFTRLITYKEPIYMQKGFEQFAEHLFKSGKTPQEIGAEFTEDGKFKELILNKKGDITGFLTKYCGVKGADSQQQFNYDAYWEYRQLIGDMSPEDWKLKEYDWAYEIKGLSSNKEASGLHFDYPKDLIDKAEQILKKYPNGVPIVPQGVIKPQFAGKDKTGASIGLKCAGQYVCWRTEEGTGREKAYVEHKKKGIDCWGYESAEKFGLLLNPDGSTNNFYGIDGKYSNNIPPVQYLYPDGWGKQTEMPAHDKVVGSQKEKQIMTDVHPDLIPVRDELMQTKDLKTKKLTQEVLNEAGLELVGTNTYKVGNPTGLVNRLRSSLRKANVSDDQIYALKVIKDDNNLYHINGVSFDAHPSKDAIERMLWSTINKEIVSPKQFGIPALITPELGTESNENPVEFAYINKDTKQYVYVEDKSQVPVEYQDKLHIVTKEKDFQRIVDNKVTPASYILPWPYGKFKNPQTGEALHPKDLGLVLGSDGIWRDEKGLQNPKLFKGIGWRIPTPGKNSVVHINGIGMYGPERGQIATVTSSEVGRMDKDFDGDKDYIGFYNSRVVRTDFGSEQFKNFMLAHLEKLNYANPEAEFNKLDENGYKKLNHANWTERAAEKYDNEAGSIEGLGNALGEDYLKFFTHIKQGIQEYNQKYKENVVLEPIDSEEDSVDGLSNKILDLQWKLLEAPQGYTSMMTPITLGDIPAFSQKINNLQRLSQIETDNTAISQMVASEKLRKSYLDYKDNIGVLARACTMHVMCNIAPIYLTGTFNAKDLYFLYGSNKKESYGLGLNKTSIKRIFPTNKTEEGKEFFGGETDTQGINTGQKFTSVIQANLEIVKSNDIKNTGINRNTAAIYAYLTELGVPNAYTFLFLNLPIIKEFQQMWGEDNSMQNKLMGERKFRSGIALELASKYWNSKNPMTNYTKRKDKKIFWASLMDAFNKFPEQSLNQLEKHLQTNFESLDALKKDQAIFLVHFLQLQQQAQQTFTLNQNINRDTANIGSFGEYALLSRYGEQIAKSGMFENPDAIFEKTFVGPIKDSVDLVSQEFASKFFTSRDARLEPIINEIINFHDNPDKYVTKDDKIKSINRDCNFLTNYLLQVIPDENGDSQFAKASRLLFIDNTPLQLSTLRRKYPDNIWLSKIQPLLNQSTKNAASSMRSYKMNNSLHDINLIVDSALVAFKSTDPAKQDLRNFFSNIAVYSLIQSGGQNMRNSIQKYIPAQLWLDANAHLLDLLKSNPHFNLDQLGITPEHIRKQIIQNNTHDFTSVPVMGQNQFTKNIDAEYQVKNEIDINLISLSQDDDITNNKYIQRRIPLELEGQFDNDFNQIYQTDERGKQILSKPFLYERLDNVNHPDRVYYKRITVLGKRGYHVEVAPQDLEKSIHPENIPVPLTQPQIDNYLRDQGIFRSNEKNSVSLPDHYTNLPQEDIDYLNNRNNLTDEDMEEQGAAHDLEIFNKFAQENNIPSEKLEKSQELYKVMKSTNAKDSEILDAIKCL